MSEKLITLTNLKTFREQFANVAVSGSYNDLADRPDTASDLEIERLFRTEYSITTQVTNGIVVEGSDTKIWTEEVAAVGVAANEGYSLPESIVVNGAEYVYDMATGMIGLRDATGDVVITVVCESDQPIPTELIPFVVDGTPLYGVNINGNLSVEQVNSIISQLGEFTQVYHDEDSGLNGMPYYPLVKFNGYGTDHNQYGLAVFDVSAMAEGTYMICWGIQYDSPLYLSKTIPDFAEAGWIEDEVSGLTLFDFEGDTREAIYVEPNHQDIWNGILAGAVTDPQPTLTPFEQGQSITKILFDPTVETVTYDGQTMSLVDFTNSIDDSQLSDYVVFKADYSTGTVVLSHFPAGMVSQTTQYLFFNIGDEMFVYIPEDGTFGPNETPVTLGWWHFNNETDDVDYKAQGVEEFDVTATISSIINTIYSDAVNGVIIGVVEGQPTPGGLTPFDTTHLVTAVKFDARTDEGKATYTPMDEFLAGLTYDGKNQSYIVTHNNSDDTLVGAAHIDSTYILVVGVEGAPVFVYSTEDNEDLGLIAGWTNLDENNEVSLGRWPDIPTYVLPGDWNGTLIGAILEQPQPTVLTPFAVGDILGNNFIIDKSVKTVEEIDAWLASLTYDRMGGTICYVLSIGSEDNAPLMAADYSQYLGRPIYILTTGNAIIYSSAEAAEGEMGGGSPAISHGWNVVGDTVPFGLPTYTITYINDTVPPFWNGVFIGKGSAPQRYSIITNITNGTYSGDDSIYEGSTAQVVLVANKAEGYVLPTSITVSNAGYSYNSSTGVVDIYNPSDSVTIVAVCEAEQPQPSELTEFSLYKNFNGYAFGENAINGTPSAEIEGLISSHADADILMSSDHHSALIQIIKSKGEKLTVTNLDTGMTEEVYVVGTGWTNLTNGKLVFSTFDAATTINDTTPPTWNGILIGAVT